MDDWHQTQHLKSMWINCSRWLPTISYQMKSFRFLSIVSLMPSSLTMCVQLKICDLVLSSLIYFSNSTYSYFYKRSHLVTDSSQYWSRKLIHSAFLKSLKLWYFNQFWFHFLFSHSMTAILNKFIKKRADFSVFPSKSFFLKFHYNSLISLKVIFTFFLLLMLLFLPS